MKNPINKYLVIFLCLGLAVPSFAYDPNWDTHTEIRGLGNCTFKGVAKTTGDPGRWGCVAAAVTGHFGNGLSNGGTKCNGLVDANVITHQSATNPKPVTHGQSMAINTSHSFVPWGSADPQSSSDYTGMSAACCDP